MSNKKLLILFPANSKGIINSHKMLYKFIYKEDPDLMLERTWMRIISNSLKSDRIVFSFKHLLLIMLLKLIKPRRKYYFFCHGWPEKGHYNILTWVVLLALYLIALNIANATIFVSKETRRKVFAGLRINTKSYIFHNILNEAHYKISPIKQLKFVYFGRVHPAKNIEFAAEVVRQYNDISNLESVLEIYGCLGAEGKFYLNQLQKKYNKEIIYRGAYDGVREIASLVGGHIFMSFNLNEPFGIAYIEALEAGCLPVIPVMAGVSEVLTGQLLVFNNIEDLVKQLVNLCKDVQSFKISQIINDDRFELEYELINKGGELC